MSNTSDITLTRENATSDAAIFLITQLSEELAGLYGDNGTGDFSSADVLVPRSAFIIAWRSSEPVGCGAVRPINNELGEIKRMFVMPQARGLGISRRILYELETLARGYDYQRLWLETGIKQTEAIKLYTRSGYERMKCYGKYLTDPMSVCFEKVL